MLLKKKSCTACIVIEEKLYTSCCKKIELKMSNEPEDPRPRDSSAASLVPPVVPASPCRCLVGPCRCSASSGKHSSSSLALCEHSKVEFLHLLNNTRTCYNIFSVNKVFNINQRMTWYNLFLQIIYFTTECISKLLSRLGW